jgi:hypothetical protein
MYSHRALEQRVSVGNVVERKKGRVVPYAKQASVIDSNVLNRNKDSNVLLRHKSILQWLHHRTVLALISALRYKVKMIKIYCNALNNIGFVKKRKLIRTNAKYKKTAAFRHVLLLEKHCYV